MARFRLRFLLQELELTGPTVTIGRSSDCQITLDDPLVSRVHARITLTDLNASVCDLGSRNGVRVNDQLIEGERSLSHEDRIRLGTQDLVFVVSDGTTRTARSPRATGAMAHCKHCGRAFPGESSECPRCGAPTRARADGTETVTDVSLDGMPSWTFRLLGEVIERALGAGRVPEAERMLQRAARELEAPGLTHRIGERQVSEAARYALRLARIQPGSEWAAWAARLLRREQCLPDAAVLALFEELEPASLHVLRPELEALLIDHAARNESELHTDEERERERRLLALLTRVAV